MYKKTKNDGVFREKNKKRYKQTTLITNTYPRTKTHKLYKDEKERRNEGRSFGFSNSSW